MTAIMMQCWHCWDLRCFVVNLNKEVTGRETSDTGHCKSWFNGIIYILSTTNLLSPWPHDTDIQQKRGKYNEHKPKWPKKSSITPFYSWCACRDLQRAGGEYPHKSPARDDVWGERIHIVACILSQNTRIRRETKNIKPKKMEWYGVLYAKWTKTRRTRK